MDEDGMSLAATVEALTREVRGLADEVRALRAEMAPQSFAGVEVGEARDVGDRSDVLLDYLTDNDVDFIDLGCSHGGSLAHGVRKFGLNQGVGVDIDPVKVASARAAGNLAVLGDATDLDVPEGSVRLVQGLHFLEHLPGKELASRVFDSSARTAKEALYFRQPFFDADEPLRDLGLKMYWSDWHGHPNHLVVDDYVSNLERLRAQGSVSAYAVLALGPITSSADPAILPMDAPRDQHAYDRAKHGEKPEVEFSFPVFRETVVIALKPALEPQLGEALATSVLGAKLLATSMTPDELLSWLSMRA